MANKRVKIAGYARRIFFNGNIEYRDFSPDLVGFQLTSDGGTALFTNGNFSISANLDPKPDVLFTQGTKSKLFTLDDITSLGNTQLEIEQNLKTKLNLDLTNPLSYVWYGSMQELIRASLIEIQNNWPAAIYVDNKVGSVTGNNITEYVYNIEADESTFKVNSNFFVNPYSIKYTLDSAYTPTESNDNPLRNFTLKYSSYIIEHNGIKKNIKSITPATQKTNSEVTLVVDGNPFPELTGIYIPQITFLAGEVDGSIPYFIKPNESEIEKFFTGLDDFQSSILNRNITPEYRAEIISSNYTDDGVLLTSKEVYDFPVLEDGYNLNFFDSFYLSYLDDLTKVGEGLDLTKTDTIVRKYTTEAINSFDTIPRADGDDLVLNGEKATKLLRIYGVEFDYIKKYINGVKFAHVVTYNKKNNVPDVLVKDLAFMLGLEPINFINDTSFSKIFLPSNGGGQFSGTSTNLSQKEIDIELYRRLILNIAWMWKSKGTRKAVEFLFRFIGAPESLVNFNEYVVLVDKPLDIDEIKRLLYIYTGEVNLENIPYDDEGFPVPPTNGELVINTFFDPQTGQVVENGTSEIYFQKAGGWYRQTYGNNVLTVLKGNNPHVGPYDGGSEYLQYFSNCYIPNFDNEPSVVITADTISQNYFTNYNYGIFNGMSTATTEFFTTQLTFNPNTGGYQPIDSCLEVDYSIIETPLQNDGKTTLQQAFAAAEAEYNEFLERINQDSYLVYSPEWQIIKNNYELTLKNCLNEIATEDCDINKTLEICLSQIEPQTIEYSCDNLTLNECLPFYYYTNSDGIKVSFDEFPQCCSSLGSNFVSYVNEYGRVTEYCSNLAPCVGTPSGTLPNGVIEFTMTNNTTDQLGTYQIEGKCYQYSNTQISLSDFTKKYGEPKTFINNYCGRVKRASTSTSCNNFFTEVNCKKTSIISSPECCAWYGYDYQILEQNGNKFIVCKKNNENSATELTTPDANYTLPIIDFSVNNSYYDLQNPIGAVYKYYSTEIFWDCFEESRIIKEVVDESNNITATPNSILDEPSLMIPSNWGVASIDEYGRVSFTPSVYDNNFILDWYSDQQLSDLYKDIAEFYGYVFDSFTIDFDNNTLIPYNGDNPYSLHPSTVFTAAVDGSRIGCDQFNSVSVVFGSENWNGFKLPALEDCSCTIDFSFDYMLKYNAENLIQCADNISCNPAIIHDNSLYNINCLNFIAFTDNAEQSQLLENNFNDTENLTEEYVIWQNANVLNPNAECCNAMSGTVVSLTQWASINQTWVSQINQTYDNLYNNPTPTLISSLNFNMVEILNFIDTLKTIKTEVEQIVNGCFNINLVFPECDIDYSNYITTQTVCTIEVPLECGIWTKVLSDYKSLQEAIKNIINQYENTCENNVPNEKSYNQPLEEINDIKVFNRLSSQENDQLEILKSEEVKLKIEITKLQEELNQKQSDNTVINKALTNVNNPLDCSVYEDKLTELNNFDYYSYCNSIVYGNSNFNDGTKQTEYESCIKSKTIENENDKITYNKLLNDCNSKNNIETQLKVAKFDNNVNLITELQKQLNDVNTEINTLTTDFNNDISFDPSKNKSKLEENDTQNTVNKTAELLGKTTNEITDEFGNLTLTDSDKLNLNILLNKNLSQISGLNSEIGDEQDLLNENLQKQKQITLGTNNEKNNLGGKLLSWGIGLIGAYYTFKGYVSPETYGVTMAALGPVGIRTGGDKGDDIVTNTGCAKYLGSFVYDNANGYKYLISPPTNPSLTTDNSLSMSPSYNSSVWTPVVGTNPVLYVKGPCYGYRSLISDSNSGTGSGTGVSVSRSDKGDGITLPTSAVCPKEGDPRLAQSAVAPVGQILYNGLPLSEECCDSNSIGINVQWINKGCFPVGLWGSGTDPNCDITQITVTEDGVVLNNGLTIPAECCDRNTLGIFSEVDFIDDECRIVTGGSGENGNDATNCCDLVDIYQLQILLDEIDSNILLIEQKTTLCYDNWYTTMVNLYQTYEEDNNSYFDSYLDDLKINFKLFVNNTNVNSNSSIDTGLTYLPYTQSVNPIWEWDPTNGYTGVILEGDEQDIAIIKDGIFHHLSVQNIPYNSEMFEPDWKTFNFTIPECVCDDLRRLYPNKEFFFSIEIENYECSLCLLVDNIQVNVSDCQTRRILSINDCMIPQLSCVIDNKKSWVYYDGGVIRETIYPDGACNSGSSNNYQITKMGTPQERQWLNLEYRYTDYDLNHSDLLLNVKNATFSIDPAKAIECDVFNYWKNIDCDNCPTKCMEDAKLFEDGDDFLFQDCNTYIFEGQSTELSVAFSGEVLTSGYTLTFDDVVTTGLTFSCSTYTDILEQQVIELKNKYYILTSDYIQSLDATYQDLLDKGEELSKFYIQKNNCGTDTIVINDNSSLDNLFGVITENYDGTISLFETYLYTGATPYNGGVLLEVLSGVTAQTFNQTLDIDQNCCERINKLLNDEGVDGLGLGKNYQWNSSNCSCNWKPIDGCSDCKGDCEYCGTKKECVDGFATGDTYNVCINPLDYLDFHPSEINVKAVLDQLVQTNLIDVKSRQTISDYPLLRLFYELYLNASNCGKDLSGKYTYDTMFEFMDKIGDYWLDLLEQVVPATTIWEGCDNSGKIYRNTIFDQNKFVYKKYSLNFIDIDSTCPLSAYTEYSIGEQSTSSVPDIDLSTLVEQIPIYPTNPQIVQTKTDILDKELEIALLIKSGNTINSKICALNLQDLDTPNLQLLIQEQQNNLLLYNTELNNLNQELSVLYSGLTTLENQYLQQQQNYYSNFTSCSGITQSLINAQQSLTGFTQGTTAYERQRNFIAGLRDKYTKCVRSVNTLISDYNTIFITQIYDTNEYEGNITIIGDPDWEEDGPFYNQELIHNC